MRGEKTAEGKYLCSQKGRSKRGRRLILPTICGDGKIAFKNISQIIKHAVGEHRKKMYLRYGIIYHYFCRKYIDVQLFVCQLFLNKVFF